MNRFTEKPSAFDVGVRLLPLVKSLLKITDSNRDEAIKSNIVVATSIVEKYTWRLLYERDIVGEHSTTCKSRANGEPMLECRRAPVFDDALVSIVFRGDPIDEALTGMIVPVMEFGECFVTSEPTTECRDNVFYTVVVTFKAGYKYTDTTWSCPMALQNAVASLAAHIYTNPTDCNECGCASGKAENGVMIPATVATMLSSYIIRRYDHAL